MTYRKRKYIRKHKFNKTYNEKYTIREKANRIKNIKLFVLLFLIFGVCQYTLATTNTITFDGDVVKEENVVKTFDEIGTATHVNALPKEVNSNEPSLGKVKTIKERRKENEIQIRMIAREFDFKWENYLVNLACCEGLLLTNTINDKGNIPWYSKDRGLYGINDHWHKEVSDACAKDLRCSTIWTMERINTGFQYEWMCDVKIRGNKNYTNKHCYQIYK